MEKKVRCILCGKEMKKILQNNDDFRIHSESYDHQGNYYNLFCDKCKEKDFMMRIQAIIRLNKINTAKNIYKSQAVRYEKTDRKRFEKWFFKVIPTAKEDYKGFDFIKEKLIEIAKEVDFELKSKIRKRENKEQMIDKMKLDIKNPTTDKKEKTRLNKEIKRLQRIINEKHKKEEGKIILPKEVTICYDG
jgi:putative protein kinase ArgK-like GTPase of G3E family